MGVTLRMEENRSQDIINPFNADKQAVTNPVMLLCALHKAGHFLSPRFRKVLKDVPDEV